MPFAVQVVITIVGVAVVAAAVWLAFAGRGQGKGSIKIGPIELRVEGVGAAMAIVGIGAMILPWVLEPDPQPSKNDDEVAERVIQILSAGDHPLDEYELCTAPSGSFKVVDALPAGPLNMRIGAGTQFAIFDALVAGDGPLRFDGCVQRLNSDTSWWKVVDAGWLFSRYVERS